MQRYIVFAVIAVVVAACGDDPEGIEDGCMARSLPLTGAAAGPTITDVGLEAQTAGIVVVATATDPQGSADVQDVVQTISVYPDADCAGSPISIQDDLVGSGIEETFGTVVGVSDNPALYEAIANAERWPVEVDFRDREDNRTTGRVMARVFR